MRSPPGAQSLYKELLRPHLSKVARGSLQARLVTRANALLDALQHFRSAFGKLVEVVDEVDQQKLAAELLGKRGLHAKIKLAAAQRILAMALVIIDDGLVVELRRPHSKAVVGIGR